MNAHSHNAERGSALIMALVFVAVTSLVVMALLPLIESHIKVSAATREHADQVYAADAGIEHVLEQMRLDRTSCPTTGSTGTFTDLTIDGQVVHLSCETTSGSSSGAEGWAVITTSTTADGLTTQSGGTKSIEGPIFAARLGNPSVDVTGDVVEQAGSGAGRCAVGAAQPSGLNITPSPPYGYSCVSRSVPTVAHELPAVPGPTDPAFQDVPVGAGTCRVFLPGTYTTAPVLGSYSYFTSGSYYFQNIGNFSISGTVIGGEKNPLETISNASTATSPCASYNENSPTLVPGTGVQWILGGDSRISVGNNQSLELYARSGGSEPRSGISIHAVTPAEATGGYAQSTVGGGTPLIDVGNGAHVESTIHGTVYAPDSDVSVFATNSSEGQFQGGLVVSTFAIKSSGSASGLVIAVDDAPVVRQVTIRAVAEGTGNLVDVTSTAVVTLGNDDPRTFTIQSWRTARSA